MRADTMIRTGLRRPVRASILTLVVLIASLFAGLENALANGDFPNGPDVSVTPGSLCQHPNEYRYPEHIPYCRRHVGSGEKRHAFDVYDQQLGYHTESMNRGEFKIDHFFPLCAGGSNEPNNLWPQHKSVYEITDPLEQTVCEKMAAGALKQKDAIELIKRAKLNLSLVPDIIKQVEAL